MYKLFVLLMLSSFLSITIAQSSEAKYSKALEEKMANSSVNEEFLVWIYFTDKGSETNLFLSNPELVVSQKSLNRRAKVFNHSDLLTIKDLPVHSEYISQVKLKGFKIKWPSKWLNAVSGTATKFQLEEIAQLPYVKKLDIVCID